VRAFPDEVTHPDPWSARGRVAFMSDTATARLPAEVRAEGRVLPERAGDDERRSP
jgi:hypothetical protein